MPDRNNLRGERFVWAHSLGAFQSIMEARGRGCWERFSAPSSQSPRQRLFTSQQTDQTQIAQWEDAGTASRDLTSDSFPLAEAAAVLHRSVLDQRNLEQFQQEINVTFLHTSLMHSHPWPYIYLYLTNLTVCHT